MQDVGDSIIGEGGLNQTTNSITDFYLAIAGRLTYPAANLNNRAASFVTERSHGIGMGVAAKPTAARIAPSCISSAATISVLWPRMPEIGASPPWCRSRSPPCRRSPCYGRTALHAINLAASRKPNDESSL